MYGGTFLSTLPRSTNRGLIDALTTLRNYSAAAISATTVGVPIEYAFTAEESVKVIMNFAAYSGYVASSAEWVITTEISATLAGTYRVVDTIAAFIGAGAALQHEIFLGGRQMENLVANARFMRVTATRVGAPGNLVFGSYLVPSDC